MSTETKKNNSKSYVHFIVTVLFMFCFRFIPAPDPITPYGMAVLGIFIGLIYSWTVSTIGLTWSSLLAVLAIGTTNYGNVSKAFSAVLASDTIVLLIIGMYLMTAIQKSNVGEWLIVKFLSIDFIRTNPWIFTGSIVFTAGILAFLSNSFIVALFLVNVLGELFTKAGYQRGDKYPLMMVMGVFISILAFTAVFPFRGWALYCITAFKGATGMALDFGSYMAVSIPFFIVTMLVYIVLMFIMRCDVSKMKDIDISEYKKKFESGLNSYQKKVMVILLCWIAVSIFVSFAGGSTGIRLVIRDFSVQGVTVLAVLACFILKDNGEPLIKIDECNKYFMWDMVYVVALGSMVSSILTSSDTGVSAFISGLITPILQGQSEFLFLMILGAVCLILTNFCNNMAIMMIFMSVVGMMFQQGLLENIYAAGIIVSMTTIIAFYTPAASGLGAMMHGSGWCPTSKVFKYGIAVFASFIVVLAVTVFLANLIF